MDFTILSINWTGQSLSGEQLLVLRNAAAQHLRADNKDRVFNFSHELCEGQITRGKSGTFGTFAGTFFNADLGTVDGERWTVDFLLPRKTERLTIDDESIVISTRPLTTGEIEGTIVNPRKADVSGGRGSETLH